MMTSSTRAWIVAAVLFGSISLITASPGTSDATQKFGEGPSFNRSNGVQPFTSDIELQQRISKFSRRSKRDTESDVVAGVIAGLNVIGIAVSVAEPISGSCILIFTTLLQLIFSGNEDPVKQIQDIVWNERVQQQKLRLISIRDTMNEIKRQYETTANILIPHGRMLTLYDILKSQRCLFMHDDNIEASADYFSEFAVIHIAVNQALILIHPDERIFQESLVQTVKGYVAYAKHAQQIETQNNYNRKYRPRSTRVRSLLDPHIRKWTKQLPVHLQAVVNEQGWIENKEVVSFQLSKEPGRWMSCWVSGSVCTWQTCPGRDNPMERGSQYKWFWKCRGEVFWIDPIDETDGFIRSCSRVGIQYSKNDKGHWWVSASCGYRAGECKTRTKTCPGDRASNMRHGGCSLETWSITAKDKPCGEAIRDRDVVELRGEHGTAIKNDYYDGLFTIFRSNVDYGEYTKDMLCRG